MTSRGEGSGAIFSLPCRGLCNVSAPIAYVRAEPAQSPKVRLARTTFSEKPMLSPGLGPDARPSMDESRAVLHGEGRAGAAVARQAERDIRSRIDGARDQGENFIRGLAAHKAS